MAFLRIVGYVVEPVDFPRQCVGTVPENVSDEHETNILENANQELCGKVNISLLRMILRYIKMRPVTDRSPELERVWNVYDRREMS